MPDRKGIPAAPRSGGLGELERLAQNELRSVNAQIEFLLREALGARGRAAAEDEKPAAKRAKRADR
jgi:hypothetical protein